MRLSIPGSPFDVTIAVVRKARASQFRLNVGGLLVLVAIAAFCAWGGVGVFDRFMGRPTSKTYYVGDLLRPGTRPSIELQRFAAELKSTVARDPWWSQSRQVTPYFLSISLVVHDSEAGHRRVEAWLDQVRTRSQAHNE